jgi:hypothetical protein
MVNVIEVPNLGADGKLGAGFDGRDKSSWPAGGLRW